MGDKHDNGLQGDQFDANKDSTEAVRCLHLAIVFIELVNSLVVIAYMVQ